MLIGYSLWFMLARTHMIQQTIKIPVFIYTHDGTPVFSSFIKAQVYGARYQLHVLHSQPPRVALYVATPLPTHVTIKPDDILLPEPIGLISYEPQVLNLA